MNLVLCFLISLLSAVKINLIGELTAGECVLGLLFFFQFNQILRLLKNPIVRSTFLLILFYLASLILSDIYRQTPAEDYLRGWAKVAMMLFAFLNLAVLLGGRVPRIKAYLLGMICAPFLSIALYGHEWELYKFYIGFPISMAAFWYVSMAQGRHSKMRVIIPFLAGLLALVFDSRALAGITLVSAIFNYINSNRKSGDSKAQKRIVGNTIVMVVTCLAVMQLYSIGAPRGWFGEQARAKYEYQTGDDSEGFSILSGRSEMFFSLPKIMSSPIVGFGSWAKDADYYVTRSQELGLKPSKEFEERGLIPTHSYIFGGWLEAGLLGGVFWFLMAWRTGRVLLLGQTSVYGALAPLINFMLIWLLWDILFSAFGGERRVQNAFLVWIITWPLINDFLAKQKPVAAPSLMWGRPRRPFLPPVGGAIRR